MTCEHQLSRSTPEAQGITSASILAFINAVEQNKHEFHSMMLLRNGHVVAEGWWAPYEPELPHMLYSLSKSFCSTAAGLAINEGFFSLDDFVISFFPDDLPNEISENLASMRVRHLLSMSTGQATDATGNTREAADGNWAKGFLSCPVEHEPGSLFSYNSAATYMVSAIVQKTTGCSLMEFLQPRLFGQLGITGASWETCPRGINVGGWGLSIKTEDIALFGQLYLQKGLWQGERLIPEAWVAEATAKQVSNGDDPNSDWNQGYGFQFWRCRHGAYRADGAFGQFCVVMPEQNAVLVVTAGMSDMHGALSLAWEHLLPGMGKDPLPENPATREQLEQALSNLALQTPQGQPTSPMAREVSKNKYRFETNEDGIESITFDFDEHRSVLSIRDAKGEHRITCGGTDWVPGATAFSKGDPMRIASRGAWLNENTYAAMFCFVETPHCMRVTCQFLDGRILFDSKANVSFGPSERPQLEGKVV